MFTFFSWSNEQSVETESSVFMFFMGCLCPLWISYTVLALIFNIFVHGEFLGEILRWDLWVRNLFNRVNTTRMPGRTPIDTEKLSYLQRCKKQFEYHRCKVGLSKISNKSNSHEADLFGLHNSTQVFLIPVKIVTGEAFLPTYITHYWSIWCNVLS